ncbi:MAG: hypothetical protein Ct9H300mP6_02530 [Gammaproteobacteria bacterium]|nr:MAG: hypothetical protein Ct9H300mP6_02530 [Gammaproteobacteria bacterium]
MVPADLIIGNYRKTLEGFKDKGYKIDVKKFKENNRNRVCYSQPRQKDRKKLGA